jgi:diguanylate cyclase (GGDEF)-like protein
MTTTILVIEDKAALREEILHMLELMDFRGIGAEDGTIGMQLACQYLPDLIVCDITLPELDGYEVLRGLRQISETAAIPFIFLAAKTDRADMRRGMNLGADDYLTKPFSVQELQEAIVARLAKQSTIIQPYINEMKRAAEQLGQMAYRDPLTRLPNRILFHQRLQEALVRAQSNQYAVAVLCINIDRFQAVNMKLGHFGGDLLLQAVAIRLSDCIGTEDTVARLSGDEFSIILTHLSNPDAVRAIAQTILQTLTAPYRIQDRGLTIQFSMGVTLYPDDSSPADKLLNHAIVALHWGRSHGNRCQFYDTEVRTSVTARQTLETQLSEAIQHKEFQIYYQPQVNLITGRIIGAEGLLRWHHPELGFISPTTFIPVAEETGFIGPLCEWVLHTVCAQAKAWQSTQGLSMRFFINLSAHQFDQPDLVGMVERTLSQTQLDPAFLGLELTETALMNNMESSIEALQQFKQMGIHLAIDDFGTGFSSLSHLQRLPIDTLKIDKTFIKNVNTNTNDAAITSAIIALAQQLKLRVVAEGVETEEQYAFLRRRGCYAMQGYLFSPAVPVSQFQQLLLENKCLSLTSPPSEVRIKI